MPPTAVEAPPMVDTTLNHLPRNGPTELYLNSAVLITVKWQYFPVQIADLRSNFEDFTLDTAGYELVEHEV